MALDVGFRAALGVGLTLVVGRATGHTVAGVTATIGALSGGFASHQGTYRSRAAIVMAASAAMGLAAFIGATASRYSPALAVAAGVIAFGAGLLVCLGPGASVVGIQAVVGLVVFSQFTFPVTVAARDAGLVLLGGAVQATLVVVVWPLRRFPAERRALSDAYTRLAEFARASVTDPDALLDADALGALSAVRRDAQPFGGEEGVGHQALAAQADRIRMELVALARAGRRLAAVAGPEAADRPGRLLAVASDVLEAVSAALRENRIPSAWGSSRDRFEEALAEVRRARDEAERSARTPVAAAESEAQNRSEALAGQLRAVVRLAAALAGGDPAAVEAAALSGRPVTDDGGRRRGSDWAREQAATLRSNLSLSSQACRHAVRLGVTVVLAVLISQAFPYGHRYWLPMTAMLVLRPDFASTVTRGLSRVAGTLIGAGLVTLILADTRPSQDWLIALVIILCFAAVSLVLANYAIFSVCIASLVVTLLAFTGQPEVSTAGARSFYTVLGAVLALAAYLLWPTWEATSLPDVLAEVAQTEGAYASEVLEAWSRPDRADRPALQRHRVEARLARSNAEASVARWLSEPAMTRGPQRDLDRETVLGYMNGIRTCVQAIASLHAELPSGGAEGFPEASVVAGDVRRAMAVIAGHVRGGPARPLPPLRRGQLALAEQIGVIFQDDHRFVADEDRWGLALALAGETDLLVNSVNTIGHLLGLPADDRPELGVTEGT